MGWRDIKKAAKARVHATFQVQALYLIDRNAAPVSCSVRIHDKMLPMSMGSIDGVPTSQMMDSQPRIIFSAAEVPNPLPRANLFVSADEIYVLGPSEPVDNGFIQVSCTELSQSAAQNLLQSFTFIDPAWSGF